MRILLVLLVDHESNSKFLDTTANSPYHILDQDYKLAAFTEVKEKVDKKTGIAAKVYKTWIWNRESWLCVCDKSIEKKQDDVNLSTINIDVVALEKYYR